MIDYIKGQIVELTPTQLILDNHGIGYSILISLQTYEAFQGKAETVAYIHINLLLVVGIKTKIQFIICKFALFGLRRRDR